VKLEAAIMDGRNGAYGAVGCCKTIKNPIAAASLVLTMKASLLVGPISEQTLLSTHTSLATIPNASFDTPYQRAIWETKRISQDSSGPVEPETVGIVVLDKFGALAVAGSTGGLLNKPVGRLGDTAIPGAGLFANTRVAIAWYISCPIIFAIFLTGSF
jgi:beta-aspartyl-peptidase (threonine type)